MSGAALFHKTTQGWEEDRYSLLALAPAMLHQDTVKQALYRTLGVGIGAGWQYEALDRFKQLLVLQAMELLAAGATDRDGGASCVFGRLSPFYEARLQALEWVGPVLPEECDELYEMALTLLAKYRQHYWEQ